MPRGKKREPEEIESWVRTIVPMLQRGSDLHNACLYAKIPYTTLLDYYKKDESVRNQIDSATSYLDMVAETVIADKIIKEKSDFNARWRLERTQKDKYSSRQDLTSKGNELNTTINIVTNAKKDKK